MHTAMMCRFPENKIISAALCLTAANIFEAVGYTVHLLSFHACQRNTSIVVMPSCRLKP